MMKKLSFLVLMSATLMACQPSAGNAPEAIMQVMNEQAEAWNKGDVEGYMKGYWMSEQMVFTGGTNFSRGWQQALDRYKASYPDQAAMGILEFSEVETKMTGSESAYSTGAWRLKRAADTLQGRFTLVWQKVNGAWVIVADHSC